MSSEPLLYERNNSFEMSTKTDLSDGIATVEEINGRRVIRPTSIERPEDDPEAPSRTVGSRKQRLSDLFTILCAGCALISDGYANSLMTLINVVLGAQYPKQYVSAVSTRVSNALLVGEICGQITIG